MYSPTFASFFSALFLLHHVNAHWYLSYIAPKGQTLKEGSNMPGYDKGNGPNGFLQTAPVAPADTNPLMKCGTMGVPGNSIPGLQVEAGVELDAQFLHDTGATWDPAFNSNHHGFTSVFISPLSAQGEGQVWTKIYEDGYHPEITQEQIPDWTDGSKNDECKIANPSECRWVGWWATDILRYNGGKLSFTIPASVPDGKYILRAEMLGTYLANTVSTAQSYVGCSVVQVGAGGDGTTLPNAVAFPDTYAGHPWMYYAVYANYPNDIPEPPGPQVWTGSGVASSDSTASSPPTGDTAQPAPTDNSQYQGRSLPVRRRGHGRYQLHQT